MNDKGANETAGRQSLSDCAVADGRKLLHLLSDGRFDELIKLEAEYYFRHIRSSETQKITHCTIRFYRQFYSDMV